MESPAPTAPAGVDSSTIIVCNRQYTVRDKVFPVLSKLTWIAAGAAKGLQHEEYKFGTQYVDVIEGPIRPAEMQFIPLERVISAKDTIGSMLVIGHQQPTGHFISLNERCPLTWDEPQFNRHFTYFTIAGVDKLPDDAWFEHLVPSAQDRRKTVERVKEAEQHYSSVADVVAWAALVQAAVKPTSERLRQHTVPRLPPSATKIKDDKVLWWWVNLLEAEDSSVGEDEDNDVDDDDAKDNDGGCHCHAASLAITIVYNNLDSAQRYTLNKLEKPTIGKPGQNYTFVGRLMELLRICDRRSVVSVHHSCLL